MKIMGNDNLPVGKPEVTKLNEKDEQEFLKWYNGIASAFNQAPDPDDPLHFYDFRGFYSELKNASFIDRMRMLNDLFRTRHFPDTYKLPGHPTFSTQSKYYQDGMAAGTWDGDRFVLPMPEYNVFADPKSYSARDAHRRSLDAFIKANPVVAGLRTADFADLLSAFAGLESSYRRNAANDSTSYSGWYGLRGGKDMSDDMQHRKALEHLAGILKGLTTEDMKKADERWYTPAQALYKGWNQGTGALVEFLNNGVYSTQGNNPDIGIAGNNIDVDVDLTPYLRDAITDDYYIVKEGDTFDTIQSRARHAGRHYNRAGKDLAGYNTPDIMKGKLKIGDRIWFTTPYATGGDLRSLADRIVAMGYEFSDGGKIHIKPERRGKFTALKKRTGHSASWFKAHGTPAQKKMAVFELNSRKWKHGDGGLLKTFYEGGDTEEFFDKLPAATKVAYMPSLDTQKGKTIARKMAYRVANGRMDIMDVPQSYRGYVSGEVAGINVARGRDKAVPYALGAVFGIPAAVAGGAELAVAAPALLAEAKATAPLWGKAVTHMLRDLPAFELLDRAPTMFGGKRYTQAGGDATQWIAEKVAGEPLSETGAALARLPGEFIAGAAPGMAGDVLIQKSASLATRGLKALSGADGRIFNSQIVRNPENFYRSVDKEAILDAKNSGLIRGSFPDSDFPGSPYFARSQEPFNWRKYVIEGNRESADKWISASSYNTGEIRELPAKPPYDFSGSYEGVPKEISSASHSNFINEYEAFPMTDGSVNGSKAHNFVYWQKYPLLGWRKHSFTNQNVGPVSSVADAAPHSSTGLAVFTDRTPRILADSGNSEAAELLSTRPYEVETLGGGYMLKSLMRGNPLEKQIGKNGTVSVNNVRALVGKGSKVEQAVVDKVLASEEFAGKKSVDYNKFRKAVQDELITYDRTPETRWEEYGARNIGINPPSLRPNERPGYSIIEADLQDFANRNGFRYYPSRRVYINQTGEEYSKDALRDLMNKQERPVFNTFTFSSSRIPSGSSKHYHPNTLGHSRTYTTPDEPDVLHVMESQSDWAQAGKEANRKGGINSLSRDEVEGNINSLRRNIARDEAILEEGIGRNGAPLTEAERFSIDQTIGVEKEQLESSEQWLRDIDAASIVDVSQINQEGYLVDNFASRQIQENLRYAAEKGQKKMRYPTRETAAKIEGYPEQTKYFDKNGFEVKEPYEYPEDVAKRIEEIQNEIDKIDVADLDTYAPFRIEEEAFAWGDGWQTKNAKMLAKLRDSVIRDRDTIRQLKLHGDENPLVEERLAKNEDLFNRMLSRYEKEYGETPSLDEISAKSRAAKARREELQPELKELLGDGPTQLKQGLTQKKVYMYEDILKKYTDFPKQYKKLFKNADVRTVTDAKGNTWYEVDVPENYLQQEWAYAKGGHIDNYVKTNPSVVLDLVRKELARRSQ